MDASPRAQNRVDYLRLSITDRCNLRCRYCMPPDGVEARDHGDILSYEELAAFTRVAAGAGITKVRITGGEPLVRLGCADFVGMLSRTSGIHDISLTTNGLLLPKFAAELAANGLRASTSASTASTRSASAASRAAASSTTRWPASTRRSPPGSRRSRSTRCCCPACSTSWTRSSRSRASTTSTCASSSSCRWTGASPATTSSAARAACSPPATCCAGSCRSTCVVGHDGPYGHGPAQYWKVAGARGTIGFIAGVSEHFCENCNRLRLTADGRLRTCLFSGEEVNVRPLLADPEALRAAIDAAVAGKVYDRCSEALANDRAMSQIGG